MREFDTEFGVEIYGQTGNSRGLISDSNGKVDPVQVDRIINGEIYHIRFVNSIHRLLCAALKNCLIIFLLIVRYCIYVYFF